MAHIPRGCCRQPHWSRPAARIPWDGVGWGPKGSGRGRGRLLPRQTWRRLGREWKPSWRGLGWPGTRPGALEQIIWIAPERPSHPSFAKTLVRFGQSWESAGPGPMFRGCGLPGCGQDGGIPLASVCPLPSSRPHPWSSAWERKGKESLTAHLRLRDYPSAGPPRQRGPQRPPGTGAETALNSCTNLCTPLYICYIECIYVGNMLASPVCRCCALCAPQHGVIAE